MPFKSDKQRRYLFANEPEIAKQWTKDYASGGMIKKAIAQQTKLPDLARLRSGGLVSDGSLTPGKVGAFKKQCEIKFRDS